MKTWENKNFGNDEKAKQRKITGLVIAKIFIENDIEPYKIFEYLKYYDGMVDMLRDLNEFSR